MNNLYLGMFDFLDILITPLWILVILIFLAILIVLSRTIIREAKKRQKGIKPAKVRTDFLREIEPYSEMPYIRITFDGKKPDKVTETAENKE